MQYFMFAIAFRMEHFDVFDSGNKSDTPPARRDT